VRDRGVEQAERIEGRDDEAICLDRGEVGREIGVEGCRESGRERADRAQQRCAGYSLSQAV
jgi:hypothetical protein